MTLPLAYFLTWTCYGQRLHGDARGSVDRAHNAPGTPLLAPDPQRRARELQLMRSAPVALTGPMRRVADEAIVQLCAERGWALIARNVLPSHVHTIVDCGGRLSPERALAQLKARITRDLRLAGLAAPEARLWTDHGSTRWINHERGLFAAIAYVNDWQSGPNRTVLEEHKRIIRAQIEALRSRRRSHALPADGRAVVAGEDAAERQREVDPRTRPHEPRTK